MDINKKQLIIFLSIIIIGVILFSAYRNRWIIRFVVRNRVPCVLWTKKIKSDNDALKIITSILPKNPIIIEAGAYNGDDTIRLANIWPKGHIHAFEPVPELYEKVANRVHEFKNISIYPLALSDKKGITNFFVSSHEQNSSEPSASGSLLKPEKHLIEFPSILFNKKIDIQTITIDQWAEKNNIDHIDFIWLDTQGSELMVLKGAVNILKTVKVVWAEVEFIEAYKKQALFYGNKKMDGKPRF